MSISPTTKMMAAFVAGGVLLLGIAGGSIASATTMTPAQGASKLATLPNGDQLPIHNFSMSAPFGDHTGVHAGQHHPGQDFAAPQGTPIFAAVGGKVVKAGPYGGYGNAVVVKLDNGMTNVYGHMTKVLVKKGHKVSEGDKIGLVGSTGFSTGPHLHFEVRNAKGRPVDPIKFLDVSKHQLVKLEKQLAKAHHHR